MNHELVPEDRDPIQFAEIHLPRDGAVSQEVLYRVGPVVDRFHVDREPRNERLSCDQVGCIRTLRRPLHVLVQECHSWHPFTCYAVEDDQDVAVKVKQTLDLGPLAGQSAVGIPCSG